MTGRKRPDAQLRWLRMNGFRALQRADGMPLVSRAHFESMMEGSAAHRDRPAEPDFEALNGTQAAQ